jgi:AraC-like DNA-binding protein
VHADDVVDAHDFQAAGEIERGLRFVVLLEGSVDLSYGERHVQLNSRRAERNRASQHLHSPRAMLVSIAETDRFQRRARSGAYARRLSVGVGPHWLEQLLVDGSVRHVDDFTHRHLALHEWQPSARIVAMAEQIVRAPALSAPFLNLYIESRVLDLIGEGLASLCEGGTEPAPAPQPTLSLLPHEHRRIRALCDFLQTDQAFDLSLDELARQAGTNPNTLQKHFRAVYGTTIFEHLRECRLQRAREALERDGVSVGQAAHLAGYTSAANFATAYRRRFGMPPKLARNRF